MSDNLFLKPAEFYKRSINPVEQYIKQTAFYLHKTHDIPLEQGLTKAKEAIKQGTNPSVRFFERNDQGDIDVNTFPLTHYLKEVINNNEILVPTFTTYLHPDQKRSLLVEFTDNNKYRRSVAKKEAFKAKAAGLADLYEIKYNEQTNMKLYNNSMSGAFAAQGSILHNPTAHSTLTSLTRSETAISNASNEKIIAGNRHYFNPDVTLYNLISITSDLDYSELESTIAKYNMHYPSADEVMSCIKYSTELYWRDYRAIERIENYIKTLNATERAAIVYIGDLYHIRIYNETLVRSFFEKLSLKVTDVAINEPLQVIKQTDEQIINLIHQICSDTMKGKGKDYDLLTKEEQSVLAATALNVQNTILEYKDFISTFFLTKHLPCSVSHLPNMMRRTVTVSDTDSTLFSVDFWVKWFFGSIIFNEASDGLAASVMYFATQCMAHGLALFCANVNVERSKLFDMQMKPEFAFPVLAQTPVAKHYFSAIKVKEGNVYDEIEMEIKGVNLKSSANALSVRKHGTDLMRFIAETIMSNRRIALVPILRDLANLERQIDTSIRKGEVEFFKKSMIRVPEAYKAEPEKSPYFHHILWQTVFESKYGTIEDPAYSVIKIPTIVTNVSSLARWFQAIEDTTLSHTLADFLAKNKKTSLPTLYLSQAYVASFGIPKEIMPVVDIKRIILDLTNIQRMIIDTIGYSIKPLCLLSEMGY